MHGHFMTNWYFLVAEVAVANSYQLKVISASARKPTNTMLWCLPNCWPPGCRPLCGFLLSRYATCAP